MKKVYSFLSVLMSLIIFMQSPVAALASDNKEDVKGRRVQETESFSSYDDLPDNIPVCYFEGRAIYKEDIRKRTDNGKPILITIVDGNSLVWIVRDWDGTNCIRYGKVIDDGSGIPDGVIGSGVVTQSYIDSVAGYNGSSSIWK